MVVFDVNQQAIIGKAWLALTNNLNAYVLEQYNTYVTELSFLEFLYIKLELVFLMNVY